MVTRCGWATKEQNIIYHDEEWGIPVHDDRKHFEFLILEAAQAGLSWDTVLRKREAYRAAFADFDPVHVATFGDAELEAMMNNAGLIRNRLKLSAAINNASRFLEVQAEFGSFDAYIWQFVNGRPIRNAWKTMADLPATSPISDAFSKDLKKRGFRFVGSTICYAHLQATGLINDHLVDCFRYKPLCKLT
jgi:DNA-3-methyladenine glycosylase I